MAHFAKISEDNIVLWVTPLNDKDMLDKNGILSESAGQQYLEHHNNWPADLWIQTSYNTFEGKHKLGGIPFRGNYAGIGFTWDPVNQIFYLPKPYPSWVLNIQEARWQSPIGDAPKNNPYEIWRWDEQSQNWLLADNPA
jgi:hypothetical protein